MNNYVIAGVAIFCLGIYWYISNLKDELNEMTESNIKLQEQVQLQNKSINDLNNYCNDIILLNKNIIDEMNANNEKIENSFIELENTFNKFEKTINAKPTLVQTRINNAVNDVKKCFESLSRNSKEGCKF